MIKKPRFMIIQYKLNDGKIARLKAAESQLVENILHLTPPEQEVGSSAVPVERHVYTLNDAEIAIAKFRLEDSDCDEDLIAAKLLKKLENIATEVWSDADESTIAYKDGSISIESFTFADFDAVFRDANANVENELADWVIQCDPGVESEALDAYLDRSAADFVEMSMKGDDSWYYSWVEVHVVMDSVLSVKFETPAKLKTITEVYLKLGGDKARAAMFMAKGLIDLQNSKSLNDQNRRWR
jgi:hypothetical protein